MFARSALQHVTVVTARMYNKPGKKGNCTRAPDPQGPQKLYVYCVSIGFNNYNENLFGNLNDNINKRRSCISAKGGQQGPSNKFVSRGPLTV